MSGYVNDEDIFVRTKLGSKEVADREGASIPREARTLLIMIDGRKSYGQVSAMLEKRSLYKSNGIRPFMQMLVDLELVVCKTSGPVEGNVEERLDASAESDSTTVSAIKTTSESTAPIEYSDPNERTALTGTAILSEMKTNAMLNALDGNSEVVLTKKAYQQDISDRRLVAKRSPTTEALREIISALITRHAETEQAKIYNRRLTNCHDMRSIFELIQEMQRASSDELELALYMTAVAFKRSKISKTNARGAAQG